MNDKYSRKSIYVANKNAKNREISAENGLTDHQHEALTWLCSFRHELHCNQEDLFYSESANFSNFGFQICGQLNRYLKHVDLISDNKFDYSDEFFDIPSDFDCNSDAEYEQGLQQVHEFCERVDADIIEFLQEIDSRYHTEYAPTLIARSRLI
ncbi:hypothetical protein [Succinivibrio sp.]|uniref:hypothetical protein n=1 Tax=Succinivibrio sp. TaxID=2053619 RepID=UPI0038634624